jgi:hypothetical protein
MNTYQYRSLVEIHSWSTLRRDSRPRREAQHFLLGSRIARHRRPYRSVYGCGIFALLSTLVPSWLKDPQSERFPETSVSDEPQSGGRIAGAYRIDHNFAEPQTGSSRLSVQSRLVLPKRDDLTLASCMQGVERGRPSRTTRASRLTVNNVD